MTISESFIVPWVHGRVGKVVREVNHTGLITVILSSRPQDTKFSFHWTDLDLFHTGENVQDLQAHPVRHDERPFQFGVYPAKGDTVKIHTIYTWSWMAGLVGRVEDGPDDTGWVRVHLDMQPLGKYISIDSGDLIPCGPGGSGPAQDEGVRGGQDGGGGGDFHEGSGGRDGGSGDIPGQGVPEGGGVGTISGGGEWSFPDPRSLKLGDRVCLGGCFTGTKFEGEIGRVISRWLGSDRPGRYTVLLDDLEIVMHVEPVDIRSQDEVEWKRLRGHAPARGMGAVMGERGSGGTGGESGSGPDGMDLKEATGASRQPQEWQGRGDRSVGVGFGKVGGAGGEEGGWESTPEEVSEEEGSAEDSVGASIPDLYGDSDSSDDNEWRPSPRGEVSSYVESDGEDRNICQDSIPELRVRYSSSVDESSDDEEVQSWAGKAKERRIPSRWQGGRAEFSADAKVGVLALGVGGEVLQSSGGGARG